MPFRLLNSTWPKIVSPYPFDKSGLIGPKVPLLLSESVSRLVQFVSHVILGHLSSIIPTHSQSMYVWRLSVCFGSSFVFTGVTQLTRDLSYAGPPTQAGNDMDWNLSGIVKTTSERRPSLRKFSQRLGIGTAKREFLLLIQSEALLICPCEIV